MRLQHKLSSEIFGIAIFLLAGLTGFAEETARPFLHPDRIRYDSHCLTIDGKDVFIYSGAFHYFRCPKELWRDRFQKIKDAGFNAVETYVPWNYSEQQMPEGANDFSKVDLKDLDDWLTMAEQFGFYVLVRPGPYICAEWATGGYPQWLLTKKPDEPLRSKQWLRSDDPVYLAWSEHWFAAVSPMIAKHQITRKPPGSPGVILVQLENEYDSPHFPDDVMINQLKALAQTARAGGIDVPFFTCWTHPVRGSTDPVLREMFDCSNFYPRWNVEGELRGGISKLRAEQPDAPLATTELQGGWFSQVGGKLSEDQDGITAAQIQNITLFALQMGDTMMNYYMLFGGSNLGDWAARSLTTTYDYDAPIREWGGVGDKYQRVWAIGHMLQEHGAKLARAEAVDCDVTTSQKDVTVAMRRAQDGSRYLFVRTSEHTEPREGTATIKEKSGDTNEIIFDYKLEPFGSMILYLPPGVNDAAQGEWLPKAASAIERPIDLPASVTITSAKMQIDPGPSHLTEMQSDKNLAQLGIYDSRFIFYRAKITDRAATNLTVACRNGDAVLATIDGNPLAGISRKGGGSIFPLPPSSDVVELLYENHGFGNGGKSMEQPGGLTAKIADGGAVPLQFGNPAGVEKQWWQPEFKDGNWKTISIGFNSAQTNLLAWYRMNFQLPSPKPGVWVPWHLHLNATGNGFLYLNGHAIGRYWQAGPQHDFFLPECWLNFGDGQTNNLTLSLRPPGKGAVIQSASVEPYTGFAEMR